MNDGITIPSNKRRKKKTKVHRSIRIVRESICKINLKHLHDFPSLKALAALSNKSAASSCLEPKMPQPLSFFSAFFSKSSPRAMWSPIVNFLFTQNGGLCCWILKEKRKRKEEKKMNQNGVAISKRIICFCYCSTPLVVDFWLVWWISALPQRLSPMGLGLYIFAF